VKYIRPQSYVSWIIGVWRKSIHFDKNDFDIDVPNDKQTYILIA